MEQNKIPPDNKWPAVTMRWRKLVCLVLRNLSRIQFMSVHVSGGVLGLFGSKPSVRDDEAYASVWWQYATLHLPNSPMRPKMSLAKPAITAQKNWQRTGIFALP